jgi:biopolymer transport protein ExbD
VVRKIGGREYADDAALEAAIRSGHDAWAKKGLPDAPVTIDADSRVAWNEVIKVVNIVKRCGIEKIEFAMGAPPEKGR